VPCALAVTALAALGLGLGFQSVLGRRAHDAELYFVRAGRAACALALLALLLQAGSHGSRAVAADAIDDLSRRNLPARAVVITPWFETWFRWLGAQSEDQLRADLTLVPLAALEYPHMVESLSEQAPELAPLLGEYTRTRQLGNTNLGALAVKRPVLLELDASMNPSLYAALSPFGWYERFGLAWRDARHDPWPAFHARLGDEALDPDVRTSLVRAVMFRAIAASARQQRSEALAQLRIGLALAPGDRRLLALRGALTRSAKPHVQELLRMTGDMP
jgi:hypothetical protein